MFTLWYNAERSKEGVGGSGVQFAISLHLPGGIFPPLPTGHRLLCRLGLGLSTETIPNWKSHWPLTSDVLSDSTSRWQLTWNKRPQHYTGDRIWDKAGPLTSPCTKSIPWSHPPFLCRQTPSRFCPLPLKVSRSAIRKYRYKEVIPFPLLKLNLQMATAIMYFRNCC